MAKLLSGEGGNKFFTGGLVCQQSKGGKVDEHGGVVPAKILSPECGVRLSDVVQQGKGECSAKWLSMGFTGTVATWGLAEQST